MLPSNIGYNRVYAKLLVFWGLRGLKAGFLRGFNLFFCRLIIVVLVNTTGHFVNFSCLVWRTGHVLA